jgi:hypothetical protein
MALKRRHLVLVLLLAVVGGTAAWLVGARTPSSRPGASQAPEGATSPEVRLATLDNSLRAIEDGLRDAPRDRWDPRYVVQRIGTDPDTLLDWVREHTSWIPYRGALRGPVGVLMDRQGNSLDRAMLLAALLAEAGHAARLARADLPAQRAAELLPDLVAGRSTKTLDELASIGTSSPPVGDIATRYALEGPAIERVLQGYETGTARLLAELGGRVPDQATRLLASISAPDPAAEWLSRRDSALAALRDHWWVQVQRGESWVDLDPLEASASGTSFAARETVGTPELAATLHHEITIRVIAERVAGGALSDQPTLAHTIRPSELIGRPVVLQMWPAAWPIRAPVVEDLNRSTRQIASAQDSWTAALIIGNDVVASGGLTAAASAGAPAPGLGGLGGAITRGLGRRDAPASSDQDSLLTAVWIEYRLAAPGREPRVIRRAVFDLIGEAARQKWTPQAITLSDDQRLTRALSLMMRTEILPVVADVAPEFVLHLHGRSLLANADFVRAVSREDFGSDAHATDSLLRLAEPGVSPLYTLAVLRHDAIGTRGFIDRPAILTRHQYPKAQGESLALADATDIVSNEVGIALAEGDGFAARLEQGVWDTNLEALLAGSRATANTALAYAASGDWRALTVPQSGRTRPGIAADATALMHRDLDAGYTVVAPKDPMVLRGETFHGWWRIDPATGDALGIAGTGWGQGAPDYTMHLAAFVEMAKPFVFTYALCQFIPQVANSLNILGSEFWRRGLVPRGTTRPGEGKDFEEVALENSRRCVLEAIVMGFVATAPLLMRTLAIRTEAELGYDLRRARRAGVTLPGVEAPAGTSPRPQGYPAPPGASGGRGPAGTLPGGATPSANPFGKTEPGLRPTSPGPPPTPRPSAPRARPTTPPLSREDRIAAAKEQLAEALAAESRAEAAYGVAGQSSYEATRDFVQYRATKATSPASWDPEVDADLLKKNWAAHGESAARLNDMRAASRDARNALEALRKAEGRMPPPNLGPRPQAPPKVPQCPPACAGNENPTGVAGEAVIPEASSNGALEVGSAGAVNSVTPTVKVGE